MKIYANAYFINVNVKGLYILGQVQMDISQVDGKKRWDLWILEALESFRIILEAYNFGPVQDIFRPDFWHLVL